jgi:DNA-binding transcriptional LysR family regulator
MIHSNLFYVQAFISIVELKCFDLAAFKLGVSKHILYLAVNQLENKFHVDLFDMKCFSFTLTEQGWAVYEYFKLFEDNLSILIEDFNEQYS